MTRPPRTIRRRAHLGLVVTVVTLLVGCGTPRPSPDPAPSTVVDGTPSPTTAADGPSASATVSRPSPVAGPSETVLVSEVLFDPLAGGTAFVEIANRTPVARDLSGATLRVAGHELPLAGTSPSLGPGQQLLIEFDGGARTEPGIIHAPPGVAPSRAGGAVELLDPSGRRLDHVAWGSEPEAVSTGPGGLVPETVAAGSTIGRPPGADAPNERLDWVVYGPGEGSPGASNPLPRVAVLLPLDGAVLGGPEASLSWYAVTGATSYHLQVAHDPDFSSIVVDITVETPEPPSVPLPDGRYVWRVASIGAGGAAAFSEPSGFEVRKDAGASTSSVRLARTTGQRDPTVAAAAPVPPVSVPYITQHKDTEMLLLETPNEHGTHAWDVDHHTPSATDPADAKNCAIAAVVIVNHFYGGDMSQDRLGFEILRNRQPGPEMDLNYGGGMTPLQVNAMIAFALGGAPTLVPAYLSYDDAFADIKREIDAGRPVIGANTKHTFVITHYQVRADGHRIVSITDPANGRYTRDLDATRALPQDLSLWFMPARPAARDQEAGVTTDSDGDDVYDFDETERFHTDPYNPDSDADNLRDKEDIVTGVFDPDYGYATRRGPGRDLDGDGLPTERDLDSDNGECPDGEEDTSKDGHRQGRETYNLDVSDDACFHYRVTITWSEVWNGTLDKFVFIGIIATPTEGADPNSMYLTGVGTVEGARRGWAACSVDITPPSGEGPATFGATIVGDTVTVGAFASIDNVLAGVNTEPFEMPKTGGTQYFSGAGGGSDLCPLTWSAKVQLEAVLPP